MLLHYPEALETLSRDVVVAFWIYDEDSGHPLVEMLQERGFEVVIAAGLCNWLSRRRAKGVVQALETARARKAGMMVTNWEDCRWELAREVIPLIGDLVAGKDVSVLELDVMSRFEALRFRPGTELHANAAARLRERLDELPPSFSGVAAEIRHSLDCDHNARLTAFLQHHYPEGRRFELLNAPASLPPLPPRPKPTPIHGPSFGITVDKDDVVSFHNGAESFKLYPKFGMSLQDWRLGRSQLIESSLPKPGLYPGGYRSYSGVGGLRPIHAFGAWHNPCVVWNYPFDWRADAPAAVDGSLKLHHAELTCRVAVERGDPGFRYQLRCVNTLGWRAVFRLGFNFPVATVPGDLPGCSLNQLRLADVTDSLLRLPGDAVAVHRDNYTLTVRTLRGGCDGVWIDWSDQMLTPDFRCPYAWLNPGEAIEAEWIFSAV